MVNQATHIKRIWITLLAILLAWGGLSAQENGVELPAKEGIEATVSILSAKTPLSAEETELLSISQEVLAGLAEIARSEASIAEFHARPTEVSTESAPIKLVAPPTAGTGKLEELAAKLREIEAAHSEAVKATKDLENEATRRGERIKDLPEEIAKARTESEQKTAAPTVDRADVSIMLGQALRQTSLVEITRLERRIKVLEAEARYYVDASKLLTAQRSQAEAKAAQSTRNAEAWRALVDEARNSDALAAARMAADEAAKDKRHPYLIEAAQENLKLAEQRSGQDGTAEEIAFSKARLIGIRESLSLTKKQLSDAKNRLNLINEAELDLGAATGKFLRKIKSDLPKVQTLRTELEQAARDSAKLFFDADELGDRNRNETSDIDFALETARSDSKIAPEAATAFDRDLRKLLTVRRELISTLKAEKESLMGTLGQVSTELQSLLDEVTASHRFISENILWIRSHAPWEWSEAKTDLRDSASLLASPGWVETLSLLTTDILTKPYIWAIFVLLVVLFLMQRPRLKKLIKETGDQASSRTCSNIMLTLQVLGATAVLSGTFWLLAYFPAWRLSAVTSDGWPRAFASTMMLMSGYVLFFSLCYQLLRPNGLAEAHFEMGANIRKRLRQELMWFVPTYLAIIFMVQLHRSAADDLAADGRSIYLLQMLVLMVMAFRCLSITLPSRIGKFQRFLSYSIVLAIPISLAVATVLGYQYSVIELELRWRWTAWLVLGTILLYVLVIRAVNLARRQLKQTQAKALREQKRAERERLGLQEDGALTGDIPETPVLDVDEAQRQSDRLVRAVAVVMFVIVLWSIWGAVLPAFQKLEQVNVWPATPETVSPSAPSTPLSAIPGVAPSPTSSSATNEATISPATGVSQADVVKALLTLLLCYVGLKNIPGLLEVAVLQHINLRQGSSYAITSTVRYLIVVVGLIVAFGYINISWSKVQWLAAAVTVGIGFGLQEIFANFVAGLIILYERPMRIGDIVSVGATSGKVTQIRMRATTITEFNNRDLVMPNKSFITGDFINWTLTNTVLRTEIQVGIAYGSDVHLTRAILERVGQEHPLTLEDPAPQVLFNAFGNSTLDFELRVHVGKVDDLLPVKNDLHYAINDAFKEAGIEIAFPQLDVNLKPQNLEDNKGK